MNVKRLSSILVVLLLTTGLQAIEKRLVVKAGAGLPYFSSPGHLDLVFNDSEGYVFPSLHARHYFQKALQITDARQDHQNQLWVIWEGRHKDKIHVYLGLFQDDHLIQTSRLSQEFSGQNWSPSLAMDSRPQPWVAWVNVYKKHTQLIILNYATQEFWTLTKDQLSPIFSPQLIIDRADNAWVFWVGQDKGHDEIFCSQNQSGIWSSPKSLTPDPSVPHFFPSVAINELGFPAVSWCAFDGEDYEIYYCSWDGTQWTAIEKVTDNSILSDAQPSLVFYQQSTPVIAWTCANHDQNHILLTYRDNNKWQPAKLISQGAAGNGAPKMVVEGNDLAILWKDQEYLYAQPLSFERLSEYIPEKENKPYKTQSLHLEKDKFIAFGDSITFGSMNGPRMGEGYPPRLQLELKEIFSDPLVVNRGVPGEATWEAISRIGHVVSQELALYLLLMEGTNDVSAKEYSLDTIIFNLAQILTTSMDKGVFPLISTIIPRARARWTQPYIYRTKELNTRIAALAEELNIIMVNNYWAFVSYPAEEGGFEALICSDNLHPNDKGYQVMADTWYKKIKTVPFPPINILAERSERERNIRLSWEPDPKINPASDLQFFQIYRHTAGISGFFPLKRMSATEFSYQDENINVEDSYSYILTSINADNIEGPYSQLAIPVRGEPYPPQNVQSTTILNKALLYREYINRISWEENELNDGAFTVASYRIYRKQSQDDDSLFALLDEVPAGTTDYLDRDIRRQDIAEDYVYAVSAVDEEGRESPLEKE